MALSDSLPQINLVVQSRTQMGSNNSVSARERLPIKRTHGYFYKISAYVIDRDINRFLQYFSEASIWSPTWSPKIMPTLLYRHDLA
ncbi:hypothetical protein TNCV_4002461 [Trichonephila clavipes]|uniref:Uncharacterized protein n=1 Tax=Trichonephila clavipes TaxID=2585209 RepID=A0A8X6V867_TRICX|nr:hypothetical protein TNCV_4002461 [Trichonephila clavipes]